MKNDKTRVVALDTSTKKTGWANFENGKLVDSGVIDFSHVKNIDERMKPMIRYIYNVLDTVKPNIVYIETPVVIRNAQAQRNLTIIMGCVYGWCIENNVYFEDIRPTVWRKYASDGEKLPKKREELKEWSMNKVKELFGKDVSDDESDAILLGYSGIVKYSE